MALQAITDDNQGPHRVLIQDGPAEQTGVWLLIWQTPDNPLPDREVRQVDTQAAKQFCETYYAIPKDRWREVPDEDLDAILSMPPWYKTYRKQNPWTWFT